MHDAHIVIVDDDPVNLDILTMTLELIDVEATPFENGQSALEHLQTRAEPPPVLIVDRMMPEMDGLELVRRVRADRRFDAMRIIMASASVEPEEIAEARAAGADDYLTKPHGPDDLLALLGHPPEAD